MDCQAGLGISVSFVQARSLKGFSRIVEPPETDSFAVANRPHISLPPPEFSVAAPDPAPHYADDHNGVPHLYEPFELDVNIVKRVSDALGGCHAVIEPRMCSVVESIVLGQPLKRC